MGARQRDPMFDHRPFGHSDRQNFEAGHLLQLGVIIESKLAPIDCPLLAEIEKRGHGHGLQPDDRVPHADFDHGAAGASQRQQKADCQGENSKHADCRRGKCLWSGVGNRSGCRKNVALSPRRRDLGSSAYRHIR